jgi:Ca-activated chloride channel family protein
VKLDDAGASRKGIASVWARMKLAELSDLAMWQTDDSNIPQMIKQVALEHGLMSAYTAFVAVDSSAPTAGDYGTTIAVPVPVPAGVRYETTVPER